MPDRRQCGGPHPARAVRHHPEWYGFPPPDWYSFSPPLTRSSCRNYLRRLGFVLKRPKKRLLKADPVRREAFVAEYAALTAAARRSGAKIFFADEAHFQADADLRGKWVLKGQPALVGSTSPRRGRRSATTRRCVWRLRRWR